VNQANLGAQAGADFGATPLHAAAWQGYDRVAEALLREHADATRTDVGGRTPADLVPPTSHYLKYILSEAKKDLSDIYRALLFGNMASVTQQVRRLLDTGGVLDLSAEESERCTPSQRALLVVAVQSLETPTTRDGLDALSSRVTPGQPLLPTALCDLVLQYSNSSWDDIHAQATMPPVDDGDMKG